MSGWSFLIGVAVALPIGIIIGDQVATQMMRRELARKASIERTRIAMNRMRSTREAP